ncbi:MAG TPA: hypothetical protein ENI87_02975 [bacterium]|nr:hypothetical protein [bacterium]
MDKPILLPVLALSFAAATTAQSVAVVPAQYAALDANRMSAIPGSVDPSRHQILVGASHLTALVGHGIQAIELRRSASNRVYQGGAVDLAVDLSITPTNPLDCSPTYAVNAGTSPVNVFTGTVAVATSPASPGPAVSWSPANTVRIPFATPFHYTGGTLCIDIVGTPVTGQNLPWWPADGVAEAFGGTVTDLGGGCGSYLGWTGQSAFLTPHSLVAGGFLEVFGQGTPYGLAIAAFGVRNPNPVPLWLTGLPAASPSCELHLNSLDMLMPTVFLPDPDPAYAGEGGKAHLTIKIPASPVVFGYTMTTQWLDWSEMATSNAIEWSVASLMPALDMALITGHPAEATGRATPNIAPVLRFEYQ